MFDLRRFWSEHKEDLLLVLVVISLFLGAFVLISYLLVYGFESPTSLFRLSFAEWR
jgi:Kef-type K+ transport system membrane component KefB